LDALSKVVILDHVAHLQVLVIDHIIGTQERQRCFVVKVLPLVARGLMYLGKECDRLASAGAAFPASGYPLLS
jgi:hypothetical protein